MTAMTQTTVMTDSEKVFILILAAAGSSTRMGTGTKKEYLPLENSTVLATAAKAFLNAIPLKHLIITVPEDGESSARKALFSDFSMNSLLKNVTLTFCQGGDTRQSSVFKALQNASSLLTETEKSKAVVLIHDGARPFVTKEIILETTQAAVKFGAAVPALTPVDTQKEINSDNTISRHLLRKNLCAVQTPQVFLFEPLLKCHSKAALTEKEYTDDTQIWDDFPEFTENKKVKVVKGNPCNKKITYKEDLEIKKMIRIGLGTDFHKLAEGRKFFLGGLEIPCIKGEVAHSDGDVLLHAITDALLGASGLGDIGSYFPPEDLKWKDASSSFLIQTVWKDVKEKGWSLVNMDCVVETELPKLLPWREKIIASIAEILNVEKDRIFVKAKTNEKSDSVGKGEAIKAYCTCLLEK